MQVTADSWWNFEGFPTPDEWQALTGVIGLLLALAGAFFTLNQLKLSREANQRAADAAESAARPYVTVALEMKAIAPGDPRKSSEDSIGLITIQSLGNTPAREIRLEANPPFETSGWGRPLSGADPAQEALTKLFSGEVAIGMLGPGQKLKYVLDFGKQLMDPNSGRPKRYTVQLSYTDAERKSYDDVVTIDLVPWSMSVMEVEPLDTIARQMRKMNEDPS